MLSSPRLDSRARSMHLTATTEPSRRSRSWSGGDGGDFNNHDEKYLAFWWSDWYDRDDD
jgi:hypothetical protein